MRYTKPAMSSPSIGEWVSGAAPPTPAAPISCVCAEGSWGAVSRSGEAQIGYRQEAKRCIRGRVRGVMRRKRGGGEGEAGRERKGEGGVIKLISFDFQPDGRRIFRCD